MKTLILIALAVVTMVQAYFIVSEFREYIKNNGNTKANWKAVVILSISLVLDVAFCKTLMEISVLFMILYYLFLVIPSSTAICFAFGEDSEDEWSTL